jgi:hypothetical protein
MSINGVSVSALNGSPAAESDGVDDVGVTAVGGPETIFNSQTCALAFTFNAGGTGTGDNTFFGLKDGGANLFRILDNDNFSVDGAVDFLIDDSNGRRLFLSTTEQFVDGKTHLAVINCDFTQGTSGIDIYVDDMTQTVSTVTHVNQNFTPSNFTPSVGMGFFARNSPSGGTQFKPFTSTLFEFNEQPYSSTERSNLKQRSPGL